MPPEPKKKSVTLWFLAILILDFVLMFALPLILDPKDRTWPVYFVGEHEWNIRLADLDDS